MILLIYQSNEECSIKCKVPSKIMQLDIMIPYIKFQIQSQSISTTEDITQAIPSSTKNQNMLTLLKNQYRQLEKNLLKLLLVCLILLFVILQVDKLQKNSIHSNIIQYCKWVNHFSRSGELVMILNRFQEFIII